MKAIVSEKGEVTIPKALRDRLGIRPGQVLDFCAENGRLIASKSATRDPVDSVYGILKLKRSSDALIKSLRGDADAGRGDRQARSRRTARHGAPSEPRRRRGKQISS